MKRVLGLAVAAAISVGAAGSAVAQNMMFGGEEDAAFAGELWQAMTDAGLVGPGATLAAPYEGTEPHGFQLATTIGSATVGGHEGVLVIKKNFGPAGVTRDEVLAAPDKHLGAITVMFKRPGYDPETGDWFYAKYLPDGSLDKNPKGMMLAGLVGKNADAGCIACHQNADGDDYLFVTNADLSGFSMMK